MNKQMQISLICLALAVFSACNQAELTNRVQITEEVSVLMAEEVEKTESEGLVLFRSVIGSINLVVSVVADPSLEAGSANQHLESMEINVARFLQPRDGKLLHRKDTLINGLAACDFDFEIGNAGSSKYGVGRFIVKGNHFIGFIAESDKPEAKINETLRESFFNSIQLN